MLRPSILKTWERLLHERPIAMNMAQGAGLAAIGDVVAQRIEGSSTVDLRQCAMATAAGAALSGLFVPCFYRALDAAFPGTGLRAVLSKTASDIAVQGCAVNAALLVARGARSGQLSCPNFRLRLRQRLRLRLRPRLVLLRPTPHPTRCLAPSPGEPMAEVRRDMPQVLLHDCYVWLPYNLVAFRTIPTHIRPTTTALMTLGWNTYLSAVAVRARAGGTPVVAAPATAPAYGSTGDAGAHRAPATARRHSGTC